MDWRTAATVGLLAATLASVLLAWRRAEHRPFAALLVWIMATEIARRWLGARFGLIRPPGMPPFEGTARIAFHVDQAIEIASGAAMASAALVLFARRRWLALLPVVAWLGLVAYLSTHYPAIRGDALRRVYLAAELGALFVVVVSIAYWVARRERVTPARLCLGLFAGADFAALCAGAWPWGFFTRYELTQAGLAVLYLVLTLYQGVIWYSRSRSAS